MIETIGTRYIIQPNKQETTTAGGIWVKHLDATQTATIVAVGPQVQDALAVGTKVIVDWGTTVPITHKDQQYYVIESKNVLAEVL